MKKIVLLITALLLVCGGAYAQSDVLSRLKNRAKNAAENNIGNKIEQGVNNALDGKVGKNRNNRQQKQQNETYEAEESVQQEHQHKDDGTWTCPECGHDGNTGKFCAECGAKKPEAKDATWTCPECGHEGNTGKFCEDCGAPRPDGEKEATTQNVKSDFKRGEVILFEDTMDDEQIGEFPSKWDIVDEGNMEVALVNGKKYGQFTTDYNRVTPLMTNPKNYLPEVFTLEWDMFVSKTETETQQYGEEKFELSFRYANVDYRESTIEFWWRSWDDGCDLGYHVRKPNFSGDADYIDGQSQNLVEAKIIKKNAWNHFAVSFNKRALKVYVNGIRIFNVPNMEAPGWFVFWQGGNFKYRGFTNVVLAKGGVELYEQKTTDLSAVEKAIAETGKFVTNNILFETGKATLKPESMEEIQKVADYMKKNPSARFEVQGHTDNQGSDKINDPLSQQRAEAVVKALEGLGVDGFNLRAVGKGAHEPIADNGTDEGRAKNRRVEFVKK